MEPLDSPCPPSRWRPPPRRTATIVYLAVFGLLLLTGRTQLLRDPGIFWHVVVGQRMLSTGELIDRDPFSFTFAQQPWIAQQWLAECGMAWVHDVAGFTGLVWFTCAITAAIFWLVALRMSRNGLSTLPTLILCLLGTAAIAGHLHARPHLTTILFLAMTWTWLSDYEADGTTRRRLLWLVPLFMLWTNLHGGVLGGIATVFLAVCGWTLWWQLGLASPVSLWRDVGWHAALLCAMCISTLFNPYGIELPKTWIWLMRTDLSFIAEHAPLNPKTSIGLWTLAMGALYGGIMLSVPFRKLRPCWLLPLVWFLLGLSRIRHAPLFSVLALLAIADAIPWTYWAPSLFRQDLLYPPSADPTDPRRDSWLVFGVTLLPVIIAVLWHVTRKEELWAAPGSDVWPADVLPALQQFAADHPPGTPIFNEMSHGGFLIYAAPTLRVFVDDRCELYGEEFLRQCRAGYHQPDKWREWSSRFPFEAALVQTGSAFDREFSRSPEWSESMRGNSAVLFLKR